MTTIVGLFRDEESAGQAQRLLRQVAGREPRIAVHAPIAEVLPAPSHDAATVLLSRGEAILSSAVRWGLWGSLLTEIPSLIIILLLPIDVNTKVLLGATVWKFGAAFGVWFGAMAGNQRGIDSEIISRYESELALGRWLVAVGIAKQDVRYARGALLESGAIEAHDIQGTLERKPAPRRRAVVQR